MSEDEPSVRFATEVDARRKAMGRTWQSLKEETGVARSTVDRWRKGTASPTAGPVIALADATGMDRTAALQLAGLFPDVTVSASGKPVPLMKIDIDVLLTEIRRRIVDVNRTTSEDSG